MNYGGYFTDPDVSPEELTEYETTSPEETLEEYDDDENSDSSSSTDFGKTIIKPLMNVISTSVNKITKKKPKRSKPKEPILDQISFLISKFINSEKEKTMPKSKPKLSKAMDKVDKTDKKPISYVRRRWEAAERQRLLKEKINRAQLVIMAVSAFSNN